MKVTAHQNEMRRRNLRRGAAAIEFAIVLPVLLVALLGMTDFGRFSYTAVAVANAARSGAEYGSMNTCDANNPGPWQAGITQAAVDEFSQMSGFDSSLLTVTVNTATESNGLRRVSVQVAYPFHTLTTWGWIPNSFNLQQTVVMRGLR
ncbi:MAG: pilus assembly protein [Planctomycetes bacterium]|nr:pilus assembly protein [Planctomycetota bacterium]